MRLHLGVISSLPRTGLILYTKGRELAAGREAMADPANQIERGRVYRFIETVRAIQGGFMRGVALEEYWPREIADAIQFLMDTAVRQEREACAVVAESAAEPSGVATSGQLFAVDPMRRQICREIAENIRARH
jgi:hypothetical protein